MPRDTTMEAGLHWFALCCTPRREFEAAERLTRAGLPEVYVPMRRVYRRPNRYVRRKVLRAYAIMPGYLFLGSETGAVSWHAALSARWVRGVVAIDGRPLELPMAEMQALKDREHRGEFTAWGPERHMRSNREFREGQTVEIVSGPLARGTYTHVRVMRISDDEADVLMTFLGGERTVRVRLDMLEAA